VFGITGTGSGLKLSSFLNSNDNSATSLRLHVNLEFNPTASAMNRFSITLAGVRSLAVPLWFDEHMYLQWRAGFPLAPYVEKLWCCEEYKATHRQERVLPSGRFS
jgi:hypothetical protein